MDATVQQLKELLEGSKILEVRESNLRESICDFLLEKNNHKYSFTLCATELGAWVENQKDSEGTNSDVQEMFEAIFNHHSDHAILLCESGKIPKNSSSYGELEKKYKGGIFKPYDNPMKRIIGFKCKICKQEFKIGIKALKNSEYYEFLSTPKKRKPFAKILSDGWVGSKKYALEMLK
jgi:hypothetical protein